MATIANLVIQIGANAAGIKVELDRANGYLRQFANTAQSSFVQINKGLKSGAVQGGRDAADSLLSSLNTKFQQSMGGVREQMFRGVLSPESAAKYAREAAAGYNAGLLTGIAELRGRNLLPPNVALELQNQLKQAGLQSGKELSQGIAEGIQGNGAAWAAAGAAMIKGVTAPLAALGGVVAYFAGDLEVAAGRMSIVFGPNTEKLKQQIEGLHAVIPATRTELYNMAAITSELLIPLGIAPKVVEEMSIKFIRLSKDLSIINNVSPERAIHALQSALIGMTRPLKLLGVDITDLGIKMKARELGMYSMGKTLTERGKAEAAYALILERSKLIEDSAIKLNQTFSVQMRFVKRDVTEAGAAIGKQLLPVLLPLIQRVIIAARAFANLDADTLKTIVKFGILAAALGPVIFAWGKLTLAVGLATRAMILFRTQGLAAMLLTLRGNIIALGLLAIAGGIAAIALAAMKGNRTLAEFQQKLVGLTKQELNTEMFTLGKDQLRDMKEMERLKALPQKQRVLSTDAAGSPTYELQATDAAQKAAQLNKQIQDRQKLIGAVANQFNEVGLEEKRAAEELQHYLDKLEAYKGFPLAYTKPTEESAAETQSKAVQALINRLSIARELQLSIVKPLAAVESGYQKLLEKVGGINNLNKAGLDDLQDILALTKAITDAKAEQAQRPEDNARLALESLRQIRETAIDLVQIDTSLVEKAFDDARKKLVILDKSISDAGSNADPQAVRLSVQMHRLLGNMGSFVELINDDLIEIADVGKDLPFSSAEAGLRALHESLAELGSNNAKRFAALKSGFGVKVKTLEGETPGVDLGTSALDMLKSAALGVAEGFSPLAILAKLIAAALEPLQPALEAFLLPLMMVAKVVGAALIPVLRALFPVLKFFAIAATYVGEILYKVSAFILRAIGSLVRGLGRLINKLPGSPGDPLVKAGQAMLDLADGYTAAAKDMAKTREELQNMNFDDAMNAVNGLADAANRASQNIPQLFKVAAAVFAAARPVGATPGPTTPITPPATPPVTPQNPAGPSGGGGGGRGPEQVTFNINVNAGSRNARTLTDEIFSEVKRRALAEGGTTVLTLPGIV